MLTRKLLLFAVTTSVAMSLTAPGANATEPIEILEEPGPTHCPIQLFGGCTLHLAGENTLRTHFLGVEATEARCRTDYVISIDEDGNGTVFTVNLFNGGHGESNCPTVASPCAGSMPWPVTTEEFGGNIVEIHADTCIDPAEFTTCTGELDIIVSEVGLEIDEETQHFAAIDNRIGSAFCEVDAAGEFEVGGFAGGDNVHFRHP